MSVKRLESLKDLADVRTGVDRLLCATHEEILSGHTTDIYFLKTTELLREAGLLGTPISVEIFSRGDGVFAGSGEVWTLLSAIASKENIVLETLDEGDTFAAREVVMRLHGSWGAFGMYETVILGMLASATGFATAARDCVVAAEGKPVICFGSRHVHPAVAPVMERAALVAGCSAASCILGARLCGTDPKGTVPHAAALIVGDTLEMARLYDRVMPADDPRIVLVDTFKDEAEETLRVAKGLREGVLAAIRLDTPGERGGVTAGLVGELRWRLDKEGFGAVRIIVSGGLNPERIRLLSAAGADSFGVGSYISHAVQRDMTMDIKMVDGKPIAKRGRLPGLLDNPRLKKIKL